MLEPARLPAAHYRQDSTPEHRAAADVEEEVDGVVEHLERLRDFPHHRQGRVLRVEQVLSLYHSDVHADDDRGR